MIDSSALGAAITAVSKLAEILVSKALPGDSQASLKEFQTEMIRLNSLTASLQAEHLSTLKRNYELEQEAMRREEWAVEKTRYGMKRIAAGSVVYALKESEAGTDPPHYICPACYQNAKKSPMQIASDLSRNHFFQCNACGMKALNGYSGPSDPAYL